ncbi:MAG: RluA family pseudouridine synthase [Desulfopila sp.]|jgi:23S rRNA pseudouridine1911/1915/1917 synthase|nr:RluA family pseudouridine synthase [Desulfopila sp.]
METEDSSIPQQKCGKVLVAFVVQSESAGLRLDHFLVERLPHLSRSQLTTAIKCGNIEVNGAPAKASRKLRSDDVIGGYVETTAPPLHVVAQRVDFIALFEDEYLLVLSKPPGVVVHPANGNPDKTLVNGLLYHCQSIGDVGDPMRPGIVHRLDKDTSGVMVIAKTAEVHRKLVESFKSRRVKKIYQALVSGVPQQNAGRIAAPVGRHPVNRKKMAVREKGGKHAVTHWKVMSNYSGKFSLVELIIETGRTHQIRVHMASIGHPVAGDTLYGPGKAYPLFARQMLHSSQLRFEHPVTGHEIVGTAPLWPDMEELVFHFEQSLGDDL